MGNPDEFLAHFFSLAQSWLLGTLEGVNQQQPGLDHEQAETLALHPGLLRVWRGPKHLGSHCSLLGKCEMRPSEQSQAVA